MTIKELSIAIVKALLTRNFLLRPVENWPKISVFFGGRGNGVEM